jgi:3-mercaptopropionate dioxygenase
MTTAVPLASTTPPSGSRCPARLITGIRDAVAQHATWPQTAELVGAQVRRHLPGPDILTAQERLGDPAHYQTHLLHVEPDGSFSVLALVWRPGQATTIHDHVAWGAFAVLQGSEHEETFALTPDQVALVPAVTSQNNPGDVSAFAPPGDIHRVTNPTDAIVIELHVYGTDVGRLGTSVRRVYDLPLRTSRYLTDNPSRCGALGPGAT